MDEIIGVFSLYNWQQSYFEDIFNAQPDGKSPYVHITGLLCVQENHPCLSAVKPVVDISSLKNENALG